MSGKCEHGLTTRECFTCASPKYGAHATAPLDATSLAQQVADLTAERDALRSVATQVLRDMRAQGVLLEWQTLLSGAIAARAQEKPE
jgi:hypothetical protein